MKLQLVYQYRFNLSKNQNMFKKSKTKRDQKKGKKSPSTGVEARTSDM